MANWNNTYREGQIPATGTINDTTPGRSIARAITEIQEKAITDIALELLGGLEGDIEFDGNSATITLDAADLEGFTGTITIATGISYNLNANRITLTRSELEVEDGVIKSLSSVSPFVIQLASGLPSGGSQYQVLQRDGSGNAVWGWVRAANV